MLHPSYGNNLWHDACVSVRYFIVCGGGFGEESSLYVLRQAFRHALISMAGVFPSFRITGCFLVCDVLCANTFAEQKQRAIPGEEFRPHVAP